MMEEWSQGEGASQRPRLVRTTAERRYDLSFSLEDAQAVPKQRKAGRIWDPKGLSVSRSLHVDAYG